MGNSLVLYNDCSRFVYNLGPKLNKIMYCSFDMILLGGQDVFSLQWAPKLVQMLKSKWKKKENDLISL